MTGSAFRTVAPVLAVCAAFAVQPSAYPPEVSKPDVALTCGGVAETANAEEASLQAASGRKQSRKRRGEARQDKAAVSRALRGGHNCPRCGQFGVFAEGLLQARK